MSKTILVCEKKRKRRVSRKASEDLMLYRQEFWQHMRREHGLTLLDSEMDEIERLVLEYLNLPHPATDRACTQCGSAIEAPQTGPLCGLCADDRRNGR